jgi:hypothetical protein
MTISEEFEFGPILSPIGPPPADSSFNFSTPMSEFYPCNGNWPYSLSNIVPTVSPAVGTFNFNTPTSGGKPFGIKAPPFV